MTRTRPIRAGTPPKSAPQETCASVPGGCEIQDLFRLLGRAHVLDILFILVREAPGPMRFVELQERLGISPNTLSQRLKDLVSAGLLSRVAYNEIPPRVDYEATAKAMRLRRVFKALHEWAAENDLQPVLVSEAAVQVGA
jgi:DNA-binding HxlR family transcriptional regulator